MRNEPIEALELLAKDLRERDLERRPLYRSQCIGGLRPCPWVSCRYHLWRDQRRTNPDLDPTEMVQTCALDVADEGEHSFSEIGRHLGLSKQQTAQGATRALAKLEERVKRRP